MINIDMDELIKDAKEEDKTEAQPAEVKSESDATLTRNDDEDDQNVVEAEHENTENKNDLVNEEPEAELESNGGADEGKPESNTSDKENKTNTKKRYSYQEKINHSFSKLKQRARRQQQKLEEEIEELKKINEEQRKIIEERKGTTEEQLDARQDYRWNSREIDKRTRELNELKQSEIISKNQIKFNELYQTEADKQSYVEAWKMGQDNGTIAAISQDNDIIDFINESDYGPKLLEHFIRRPDVLEKFSDMSKGRKNYELYRMEQRLINFLNAQHKIESIKEKSEDKSLTENNKKSNSIIGKQITKSSNIKSTDDFATDDDVFDFVRTH